MKDVKEIVNYYESKMNENLLSKTSFSVEEYLELGNSLEKKNKEFFDLVEVKAFDAKFNLRGLQIIYNKLSHIYSTLDSEFEETHKQRIEKQPLFRYKIEYNPHFLSEGFSKLAVRNGVQEVLSYLSEHFYNEIETDNSIKRKEYSPPYVDSNGYIKFIYSKLVDPDALEKDFYGVKKRQVDKIEEFIKNFASNKTLAFPIDFKEEKNKEPYAFENNYYLMKSIQIERIKDLPSNKPLDLPYDFKVKITSGKNISSKNEPTRKLIEELKKPIDPASDESFYKFPESFKPPEYEEKNPIDTVNNETNAEEKHSYYSMEIYCSEDKKNTAYKYLIELFQALEGLGFVKQIEDEAIKDIFSGKPTSNKIIWTGRKNSLAYFIKQLTHYYKLIKIKGTPKWHVVSHFFKDNSINKNFDPKKFRHTSFKNSLDMDKHIDKFRDKIRASSNYHTKTK